jgi:hypothetical protein
MYGHGLTVLVSQRLQGPDSPPVESERWWLEMATRGGGLSRTRPAGRRPARAPSSLPFTSRTRAGCRAFMRER